MLFKSPEGAAMLKKNHSKEITAILKHNDLEQDELFKQAAIRNIKAHPFKFVTNYYYNWARMLFNFPYTYSYQDAAIVGNIIRGSLLLWASVAGIILTVINWRKVVYPIKLALLITGIYLLLSGALSAYPRQLDVVVPVLLFWLGILVSNMRKLNLRFTEPEKALEEINLIALAGDSISDKVLD
jgi:hypothetical protein